MDLTYTQYQKCLALFIVYLWQLRLNGQLKIELTDTTAEYKRLDILESGVEQDITKMNNFIAAVNNWTTSDNPTAASLKTIVP